jgi:hypothetical protein
MSDLTITTIPATGSSVVCGDGPVRSTKAVAYVTLDGDVARRTFISTDTSGRTYTNRLTSFTLYADGSVWAWAANINKRTGEPFKNGMGLTMSSNRAAEFYGQDVADVIAEAIAKVETERKLDELAARGQAILDAKGQTVDEYWMDKAHAEALEFNRTLDAVLAGLGHGFVIRSREGVLVCEPLPGRAGDEQARAEAGIARLERINAHRTGRTIAGAVPQPDGKGGKWMATHAPMCTGTHLLAEPCSR